MAVDPPGHECEYIYVLDDPPRRREAENLAALLYARHRQPITLVLMAENAGFAPACNAGLRAAQGEFVCFLNSDVFPDGAGWLDRLCARLHADPTLGIVGPMLVYEDGSVQHRGMYFHQLPQFGNWWFGDHPGKGLKPGHGDRGLKPCISITGACMVMRRDLAQALGGFDEGFVVGDFEDSDLCFRVQARGLGCSVDLDERLYHLERKSQASSALRWRMNLTVFNAWRHQRRWGARIAEISALLALTAAP
jgi:GT2 family glycosyltransferase